jgi:hypothetical protein
MTPHAKSDAEMARVVVWLKANKMTAHVDINGKLTLRKK